MQHLVILEPEPWGLPLNETLLPQRLKKNGYSTYAIGKWHLGFFKKEYTPTYRGFDSHYGYWQGYQDYYEHTVHATYTSEDGYDFRRNMTVDWDAKGKYSTTLLTDEAVKNIRNHDPETPMFMYLSHLAPHSGPDKNPLQAPDEEIAKFAHIKDPERRIYAAMVSLLDQSVGSVISALREKHMLENSIILFFSDNGAQPEGVHANHGSNYPLKGAKASAWEGALRNIAAIWSPLIKKPQRVANNLMHISDWLPTLYTAAGLDHSELPSNIDGKDQWRAISEDEKSPRTDMLLNIDDVWNYGAIRQGDWKYIYGSTSQGLADRWYGNDGKDSDYFYDEEAVLKSATGSALAGIITYQQINEKNENLKRHVNQNFTINLLDAHKVKALREAATVKCKKLQPEDQLESKKCNILESPCLFNIREDPCEEVNLVNQRPVIVLTLEQAIINYRKTALPIINKPRDPNADPLKWNNTWTNWQDCEVIRERIAHNSLSHLSIGLISGASVGVIIIIIILVTLRCRTTLKRSNTDLFKRSCDEETDIKSRGSLFQEREKQLRTSLKDEFREV
ncbi:arylsulfatase J-like isoform X2 [Cylas formicarius]|nr:arylsulfatase J-like isoform X2 [Cylas formicarius]XP_060531072.1 arylsulfatase J-like isoform X2 [Cylas formicarius]